MRKVHGRDDRTARLLREQILLWQYPEGVRIKDIALKCGVSTRTVYRDLKTLEVILGVPLWEDGHKRGLETGYFLPPVNFTPVEAVTIFLATRMMHNYFAECKPDIMSVFIKLGSIVPAPIRNYIQKTLEYIEGQPGDTTKVRNFHKLVQAWLGQRRVKILYQDFTSEGPMEHVIEPLFIEPSMHGSFSLHIIAHAPAMKSVKSYDVDQIIGDVTIEAETFTVPDDFNAIDYLQSVIGVFEDGEIEKIKLRVKKPISKAFANKLWHPSQQVEVCRDGTLIMTLEVRNTLYFRGWLLGLADNVEVIEPETLRQQMADVIHSMMGMYSKKKR